MRRRGRKTAGTEKSFYLQLFSEMLLCAAIVNSVSASCVRTVPSRFSSSSVSLQAIALAAAVMEAVNSHGFKESSPLSRYYMTESGLVSLFVSSRSGRALPPERAGGKKQQRAPALFAAFVLICRGDMACDALHDHVQRDEVVPALEHDDVGVLS